MHLSFDALSELSVAQLVGFLMWNLPIRVQVPDLTRMLVFS